LQSRQHRRRALGWDRHGRRHRKRINRNLGRLILIELYTGTRRDRITRLQWVENLHGGWVDKRALPGNPGVVHEDGHRTQFRFGALDHRLDRGGVGDAGRPPALAISVSSISAASACAA
jgi:hypothetical protein